MQSVILMVVLIAVFYALLILPQRRQQKKKTEMMKQLGPGAKILSTAGIFGKVVEIHDDVMVIQVAHDVEIEMDPRAVMRVVEASPQAVTES